MTLLYEQTSALPFLLVTLALGGSAAWLSGRAIALTWRPWWTIAPTALALGAAVRFFQMALFEGTLLSSHYYAVDTIILAVFALAGFRLTRSRQMIRQYGFLNRQQH